MSIPFVLMQSFYAIRGMAQSKKRIQAALYFSNDG